MLAPWECLGVCADALAPGGVLLCYVATVTQLSRVAEAIRDTALFTGPQSSETMVRGWHVEGLAVRPDHRMVAHTGFLITARRLAPGVVLPQPKRRASKSDYTDEDVEAWTPGALGERTASAKRLRKTARAAAFDAGSSHGGFVRVRTPGHLDCNSASTSNERGFVRKTAAFIATFGMLAALTGCSAGPPATATRASRPATHRRSSPRPATSPKRRRSSSRRRS